MSKWIKWEGGECPVEKGTLVDVKYRDGEIGRGIPALESGYEAPRVALNWGHNFNYSDIVAYRLHKELKLKNILAREWGEWPKGISKVELSPCGFVKAIKVGGEVDQSIDLTHIDTKDVLFVYKAQWQRARAKYLAKHNGMYSTMLGEEDKSDKQIDLYAAKDRIKSVKEEMKSLESELNSLVKGVADAGFTLIEEVALDKSDWRNWKKGDIIECVDDEPWSDVSEGSVYKLLRDAKDGLCFIDDAGGEVELSVEDSDEFSHEFKYHSGSEED